MGVDQAGEQGDVAEVDDPGPGRRRQSGPGRDDPVAGDQHHGVADRLASLDPDHAGGAQA